VPVLAFLAPLGTAWEKAVVPVFITGLPPVLKKEGSKALDLLGRTISQGIRGQPLEINRQFGFLWMKKLPSNHSAEMFHLIQKYAPTNQYIPLFIKTDLQMAMLVSSKKVLEFPVINVVEEEIEPEAHTRTVNFQPNMKPGTFLFITNNLSQLRPVQFDILLRLWKNFGLEQGEATPIGYVALRLDPRGAKTP
jgi:hypothetical protein